MGINENGFKSTDTYIASEELKKDEDVQAILNPPQES